MKFNAMARVLGVQKKNRITRTVRIEKELVDILNEYNFSLSDLINVLLDQYFREKGFLK